MEKNKYSATGGSGEQAIFNKEMIIPAILRNWYLFILMAVLGLVMAIVFNKYFHSGYKSTMTILLKNDPHQSPMTTTLDNLEIKEKTINIQDEQSIVSAYSLQLKTLENLNWKTSLFKKLIIGKKDLYRNEPFRIIIPGAVHESMEIPVNISLKPGGLYIASCDYSYKDADMVKEVKFSTEGMFGRPFDNEWFHFTLDTTGVDPAPLPGEDFILLFNNLPKLAIRYQMQLAVKILSPESNVLTVELKGSSEQRNVDYLNALGETYRKFGLDQKNQSAINTLKFIQEQITGVADSLQLSGNRLTSFRTNNKVVDLSQEGNLILQKAEDVDRRENTLKLKINYYKGLNKHLSNGEELKSFVAPSVVDSDPELTNLVQRLNQQFNQQESLLVIAQDKNPRLIAINNDIDITRKQILQMVSSLLANAEYELNTVEQQKTQTNTRLTNIPETERKLLDFKRGFDIHSELYNFLLQKRAEAGIAIASNSPYAQILDASTPMTTERTGLPPIANLAIGLLAGITLALGVVLYKQFTDKRLRDPSGIQHALNLSVAGMILHNNTTSDLPVVKYPNSELTETFRNLRNNLRILLKQQPCPVISIHSVSPNEGKSFVAANVASLLAISGKKVLLMDLDIKSVHLETFGGMKEAKKLSEYLIGGGEFKDIISATPVKGLSYIRAGNTETRLAELIDSANMEKLMKEARLVYDFILIDCPPMGILSEAKLIASFSDVNLFVLRIGVSTNKDLNFINKTAEEQIVSNMIVALNDVPVPSGSNNKSDYFSEL